MTRGELKEIIKECIQEVESTTVAESNELVSFAEECGVSEEDSMKKCFISDWMNEQCDTIVNEAEGDSEEAKKDGIWTRMCIAVGEAVGMILGKIARLLSKFKRAENNEGKDGAKAKKRVGMLEKLKNKFTGYKNKINSKEVTEAELNDIKEDVDSTEATLAGWGEEYAAFVAA